VASWGSLAIASWSVTQGDHRGAQPHAHARQQQHRRVSAGKAPPRPTGVTTTAATSIAAAVAERLRRLTDGGALSIHAEVEPRALGYAICAIVRSAQPRATSS
jgi:hypothetical protein